MQMQQVHEVPEVVILLAAAVAVVAVFRLLRLSPVLGYLVAGAAIGPHGIGLIQEVQSKNYIAEFGVVFLLFVIGLELSFKKLMEMRLHVLGLGGLQFIITSLAIGYAVSGFFEEWTTALVIGAALSLSSTAIVLQVLDERGERITQTGRVAFAVLLLQDLAVIPLLVVVPILAGNSADITSELVQTSIKAVIAIAILLTIGKIMLKPVLSIIARAKSSELFMATTLLMVLAGAFITEQAGLSLALGAFIAGLLLAETEFRKQVEVDIMPFKGLLLGLFFMTVGMNFNLTEMIARFPLVVMLSMGLIFFKTLIVAGICVLFKMDYRKGIKIGLLLSQASEFAFILFNLALSKGLIEEDLGQTLLLVVSFTMAITPLMFSVASFYLNKIQKGAKQQKFQIKDTEDLKGHFIICGFGWMGENLARLFRMDNFSFVAIDDEPRRVKAGREMGMPVYYGDATRQEIMNSLQVKNARAVIVTIHDTRPAQKIISSIRKSFPDKTIIARAKHVESIDAIRKAGADIVIPEAYESSIQVAKNALKLQGLPDFDIELIIENFRQKMHHEA